MAFKIVAIYSQIVFRSRMLLVSWDVIPSALILYSVSIHTCAAVKQTDVWQFNKHLPLIADIKL